MPLPLPRAYFFKIFWGCTLQACRILVHWPGTEPIPPAVEIWSLNHWTSRDSDNATPSPSPRFWLHPSFCSPHSYIVLNKHCWLLVWGFCTSSPSVSTQLVPSPNPSLELLLIRELSLAKPLQNNIILYHFCLLTLLYLSLSIYHCFTCYGFLSSFTYCLSRISNQRTYTWFLFAIVFLVPGGLWHIVDVQ